MTETQLVDLTPLPDSNTAATEVQQLQQQYCNRNNKIINIMASVDSNMLKDSTVALAMDYYHQPNILATTQWSSLKNDR